MEMDTSVQLQPSSRCSAVVWSLSVWGNIPGRNGRSVGTIRDGRNDRMAGTTGWQERQDGRNDGRSRSWTVVSSNIQAEINLKKPTVPLKDQIPKEFHEFLDVFSEKSTAQFPEPQSWDHKIELKDMFVPKSFKMYNLTLAEQIELDNFLKGNLDKGYIQPSQSPMASPFFFVNKKDGKL